MKGVIPAIILNTSACEIPHFFSKGGGGEGGGKDEKAERQRERVSKRKKAALKKKKRVRIPHRRLYPCGSKALRSQIPVSLQLFLPLPLAISSHIRQH